MDVMFFMWSGVLQGCPLSGSLYVIAANAFLMDLESCMVRNQKMFGVTRSCADDIGAVVYRLRGYSQLARVFRLSACFANLHLKHKKCIEIPLRDPACPDAMAALRTQLCRADPLWASFDFSSSCTYLGFQIGPGATIGAQWVAPLSNHATRTIDFSRQGAPISVLADLYRERALPVLGYVAQLVPLGWKVSQTQRHLISRLLRTPSGMLRTGDCFSLEI